MSLKFLRVRIRQVWLGGILTGLVLISIGLPPAIAGPETDKMVNDAVAAMRATAYEDAARAAQKAIDLSPDDRRGWLLKGMAENRLGRFADATVALGKAGDLGVDTPQIDFERGWAAVSLEQWQDAVTYLTRFEVARPGDAKTSELLGRAYFGRGEYDLAETHLTEALTRNPDRTSIANLFLVRIAGLRDGVDGATDKLLEIATQEPDSALGQGIIRNAARTMAIERVTKRLSKPWFVTVSGSGGYSDNVIGLPEGAILPAEISTRSSQFIQTGLDAGYAWQVGEDGGVSVGYSLLLTNYLDLSDFNSQNHFFRAAYQHRVRDDVLAGLNVFAGADAVDNDVLLMRAGVSPSVSYAWRPDNVSTVSYTISRNDYRVVPPLPTFDRDGVTRTVSASHRVQFGDSLTISGGLLHATNDANGDDFDYESNAVQAQARVIFPQDITAVGSFATTAVRYQNLNSQAGAGFGFKRRDSIRNLGFDVSRPFDIAGREVEAFARHSVTINDSNLAVFTYKQRTSSVGLRVTF